jgi:hypothetical protein
MFRGQVKENDSTVAVNAAGNECLSKLVYDLTDPEDTDLKSLVPCIPCILAC